MKELKTEPELPVLIRRRARLMSIVLNRPRTLNSLTPEMVRLIQQGLDEALGEERYRFVLFSSSSGRSFCAGGDIKALVRAMEENGLAEAYSFIQAQYDLCLRLHRFAKPVIVIADGVTMGAGLGLAATGDIVVATERTRMAMPETRIGFFPDVGATGWMFSRCPPGYPEYLDLTGYETRGAEAVRVGFATHLLKSERLPQLLERLEGCSESLPRSRSQAAARLARQLEPLFDNDIPARPEMDGWVATYFQGKTSVVEIMKSLRQCSTQIRLCDGVFKRLAERSPSAVVLTLKLLRHNEGRPLEEVFENDLKAARFLLGYPDFREGVRARLLDKDDNPRWQPASLEEVGSLELAL